MPKFPIKPPFGRSRPDSTYERIRAERAFRLRHTNYSVLTGIEPVDPSEPWPVRERVAEIIPPRESLPDLAEPVSGRLFTPRELWDLQERVRARRAVRDVWEALPPALPAPADAFGSDGALNGGPREAEARSRQRRSGSRAGARDDEARAYWRSYEAPSDWSSEAWFRRYAERLSGGVRQSREQFEARFGPREDGPSGGPSLSERASASVRPPAVPEWARLGYAELGGERRTARTLRGLWAPWAYRNLTFRDAGGRAELWRLPPDFRDWVTAFRKELERRFIPLVVSDASNVGVCFSLFEDEQRLMAPHSGGRFREGSPAEWSVLNGLALELARVAQVPVTVVPEEPGLFLHCDADGVVPEAELGARVPRAVFVQDGPGFDEAGCVREDYVAADGRRWFGREPEPAPDWEAELAALGWPRDAAEAELPEPQLPAAYRTPSALAFLRVVQVRAYRRTLETPLSDSDE